jgi:hypothetical protein
VGTANGAVYFCLLMKVRTSPAHSSALVSRAKCPASSTWTSAVGTSLRYQRESLVYFPQRFEEAHGGRTKEELLAADPTAAWQVLLVEGMSDLPREGQGRVIGGRRQIETGRTP